MTQANANAQDKAPLALHVNAPNVVYTEDAVYARYAYHTSSVSQADGQLTVTPQETVLDFQTSLRVPKTGLMMVGWGGNNGSTLTAAVLANQRALSWKTKDGWQHANYFGSLTQASTFRLGTDAAGQDVFLPVAQMLPMVNPNDFVLGGWDISGLNLADAMERACVLEPTLQMQLWDDMARLTPLPSIYDPTFIAANQQDRADNLITGTKQEQMEQLRRDIREFKAAHELEQVIVLWTANTERYAAIEAGINTTAADLDRAIRASHPEVSPSTLFAWAAIQEGCPFINGSPQNTFVPGVLELAEQKGVFVGGDDFKSGQTKFKSVMVDFLVNAGMKPLSITSYNHLGNNDGKNLSAPQQFRSKEISKSNVVDDMVASNDILFRPEEHPDHVVVIKYVPTVGDSKRALDEYVSEIFMGGKSTISTYNICEDSLLASPLIIDLAVLAELMTRMKVAVVDRPAAGVLSAAPSIKSDYQSFHPVLSVLSYMLKAPLVPQGTPVINALAKQRACLENIFRAALGMMPQNDMLLEAKLPQLMKKHYSHYAMSA